MKNKIIYIYFSIILLIVLGLSIGYASYNANLLVNDAGVTILSQAVVRVTNVALEKATNGAIATSESNDIENIFLSANLPNETSTITYEVTVRNFGNVPMGISNISIDNQNKDIIKLNVEEGIIGKIIENNGTTLGIYKTFNITIGYQQGVYQTLSNYDFNNIKLTVTFKPGHKVSYVDLEHTSYPSDILDNENLIIDMNDAKPSYIKVKRGNNYTDDFTYNNYILTINNVTDDITIESIDIKNYEFVIDNNSTELNTDITPANYISVDTLLTKNYTGINLSNKIITKIDVSIIYTSTTGSAQTFDCKLTHNSQTYTKTIEVQKKSNGIPITVTFDNLNISIHDEFSITNVDSGGLTNHSIDISGYSIHIYFNE